MGVTIRESIRDSPVLIFAYVPFAGPRYVPFFGDEKVPMNLQVERF